MKKRSMIPNLTAAAAAGTLAVTLIASPASAQTATTAATPTAAKKKPTSATPQMIDEAIQRSQARSARAAATGAAEQFGSEEPFTYRAR